MKIGILALQGDFYKHVQAVKKLGHTFICLKDKETLFNSALDFYDKNRRKKMIISEQPLQDIYNFISNLIENTSTSTNGSKGCFIFNTSMDLEERDQAFRDEMTLKVRWTEKFFYNALCEASRLGQIQRNLDCRKVSQILFGAVFSIIGLAKSCPDKVLLNNIAQGALAYLK